MEMRMKSDIFGGILQTKASDSFRYTNWYERGALFFMCTEAKYSAPKLHNALTELLQLSKHQTIDTLNVLNTLGGVGIDKEWSNAWLNTTDMKLAESCFKDL